MASLILRLNGRELDRRTIVKTITTVGRDPSNDLVIDNSSVSRVHASVRYERKAYWVTDAGSRNGVIVNGHRIEKQQLRFGDVIMIGKFRVELSTVGEIPAHRLVSIASHDLPIATAVEETHAVDMRALHAAAAPHPSSHSLSPSPALPDEVPDVPGWRTSLMIAAMLLLGVVAVVALVLSVK